jgi:hypothetical protein
MINQQLQGKTDNLVNVFPNHAVLREMVQAEDECGGTIGAGFPAYSHNPQPVDPEKLKQAMQKVRLLSILFTELETMMHQANLGAGAEAAIVEARQRIHEKLDHLSEEQKSFFDALVAEESSAPSNKPIHAQLRAKMAALLSVDDWDVIA